MSKPTRFRGLSPAQQNTFKKILDGKSGPFNANTLKSLSRLGLIENSYRNSYHSGYHSGLQATDWARREWREWEAT